MLPDEKIGCHRLPRRCRDGVIDQHCQLWQPVKFRNPQTGEVVEKYGCVDAFVLLATIEAGHMAAQSGAAIESFRNEVVKANEAAVTERRAALESLTGARQRFLG